MKILVDVHEPDKIVSELGSLAAKVPLPVADYHFYDKDGNLILIERKEINDLLNSLAEKRIQRQLREMLDSGAESILLVEGWFTVDENLKIKTKSGLTGWNFIAVMDFLLSCQREGVKLLLSPNLGTTPALIASFYSYYQKSEHSALQARPKPTFTIDDLFSKRIYFLMGLPGIGEEKATRILERFESPWEALFVPQKLLEVQGIGEKTVRKIVEILE